VFERLKTLLVPPIFEDDEDRTRIAGLLNFALLATFVMGLIFVPIGILTKGSYPGIIIIMGILTALTPFMLLLLRRGYVISTSVLFMFLFFIACLGSVSVAGTIRTPIASLFIINVVTAGMLLGNRGTVAVTVLSLIALSGVWWVEITGPLPPYRPTGSDSIETYAALLLGTAILLIVFTRNLNDALERARRGELALTARQHQLEAEITERKKAAKALRESEDLYRSLVEASPVAVAVTDINGLITFASPKALEIFGHSPDDDVIGRSVLDWVSPEQREIGLRNLEHILTEGSQKDEEYILIKKDGTIFIGEVNGATFNSPDGNPKGMLLITRDITERKRAEEVLRRYELLAANSRDIILFINFDGGGILEANAAAVETYGFTHDELLKLTIHDLRASSTQSLTIDQMVEADAKGILFETVHRRKDGASFPVEVSSRGATIEGKRTLISVVRDISARKRMEDELRQSEQRFRTLAEATFEGIAVTEDGRIVDGNEQLAKILGSDLKDLVGREVSSTIAPEDRLRVLTNIYQGRESLIEHDFLCHDGSRRTVEAHGKTLEYQGRQLRLTAIRDITNRKQMEDELRKSRDELELRVQERTAELESANDKLRLVPSMLIQAQENERQRLAVELHDSIGQTLAALKFRIEHVVATLEKRESEEALRLLNEYVPILQRSIDETRAIYMGLKPTILSEHGILSTLAWYRQEILTLYHKQHIELETAIEEEDIPDDLKITIFRIIQEALNNTFKHGKPEWVDIRLALNDGAIELEISDDGIGMDLDYIMESRTARSLGLIGMKERAELTGGEFTIKSAPNEGTTIKAVWRNHP